MANVDRTSEYGSILRWDLSLPTMQVLHDIGHDLVYMDRVPEELSMIVHGPYAKFCPKDLSIRAVEKHHGVFHSSCEMSKKRVRRFNPRLNLNYMELAAWEIISENVGVYRWDFQTDPQILQNLEDIGYAWEEFHSRDERPDLIVETPRGVHYVDLSRLAKGVVGRYDMVMNGDHEERKELYAGHDLDRFYIGRGLELVEERSRRVA
jgi:hypothetical protein